MSSISFAFDVTKGIFSRILFGWNKNAYTGDSEKDKVALASIPSFLKNNTLVSELQSKVFNEDIINQLSDDQMIKICRQLEFWYAEYGGNLKNASSNDEMVKLASDLVHQSVWYKKDRSIKVPKVRFGRTELQMPIVTCGGMRLQCTWLPDSIPVLRQNRKDALSSASQSNIKHCLRECMALGINHFETARFYGTSEFQMVEALYEMIQDGEIKREDFIFQTKVIARPSQKDFEKVFKQSWDNVGEKLGYIDLLSLHGITYFDNDTKESLAVCERVKKEGKIR